jgi:hypothetical protein
MSNQTIQVINQDTRKKLELLESLGEEADSVLESSTASLYDRLHHARLKEKYKLEKLELQRERAWHISLVNQQESDSQHFQSHLSHLRAKYRMDGLVLDNARQRNGMMETVGSSKFQIEFKQ